MDYGLTIHGISCVGRWGTSSCNLGEFVRGEEPPFNSITSLPIVQGFVKSNFPILINFCVQQLLSTCKVNRGGKTAILLGSMFGDSTTDDEASKNLVNGKTVNPLLFSQSIPNSILGCISREYNITGTISCFTNNSQITKELFRMAEILLLTGDAEQVILIGCEVANDKSDYLFSEVFQEGGPPIEDVACAILLEKEDFARSNAHPILGRVKLDSRDCENIKTTPNMGIRNFGGIQGLIEIIMNLNESTTFRDIEKRWISEGGLRIEIIK